MIAEVISIGDELTSGQRLDTNSQWLSERLLELGIDVRFHTTVADDLAANVLVFRQASERADIVVASGGLGPTSDDLTREALAQVAGVELVLDEASLTHIKGLFARNQRPMPERNTVQAMFPRGALPIANPHGTAPGIEQELPRAGQVPSRVFALPGVPAEMKEMFLATVAPRLMSLFERPRIIRHKRIKCFGVGESQLEQMLPDLIRRGREPSVGITVHAATITLRVTAAGESAEACFAAMDPTLEKIRDCLGTLVFGEEEDELEDSVVRLLGQQGKTLASVEWGTRGQLAQMLATAALATDVCPAALVLRSPAAIERALGTPARQLNLSGPELVERMAKDCRTKFDTDLAVALGPMPLVEQQPPATQKQAADSRAEAPPAMFYFALATAEGVRVKSSPLATHPAIWIPRAAKQALNLVRLTLLHAEDA